MDIRLSGAQNHKSNGCAMIGQSLAQLRERRYGHYFSKYYIQTLNQSKEKIKMNGPFRLKDAHSKLMRSFQSFQFIG